MSTGRRSGETSPPAGGAGFNNAFDRGLRVNRGLIQLSDGTVIAPAYTQWAADPRGRSVLLQSTDEGEHWTLRGTVSAPGSTFGTTARGAGALGSELLDATKCAIEALSRAMAVELGSYGIRVNCVSPACVGEDGQPRTDSPMRVAATPQDVADAVLFLASPAARRITGTVLAVDAGLLATLRIP